MNRVPRYSLVLLLLVAVTSSPALPRVVCLPLNNEGAAVDSWYSLGLTEALAYRLNADKAGVGIGFRTLRETLAELSLGRQDSFNDADYDKLIEKLRPDYYLTGSYLVEWPADIAEDPRFEVEVALLSHPAEEELFNIRFTGIDLLAIEVEIYKELRLALDDPLDELELDRAREVVTFSHRAYRWFCRALGSVNSGTQEAAHLRRALEIAPDFWVARRELARVLLELGSSAEALEAVLEVFRQQPDDPWTLKYYADVLERLEDEEKSMRMYRRASLADERHWRIHLELGRHFERVGYSDFAERCYEKLLDLDDDFYVAYRGLGKILLARGEYDRALELLQRGEPLAPRDPEFHSLLGQAYVSNGLFDDGIAELQRAVEQNPAEGRYAYQLGFAYYRSGDTVAADEWWRTAELLGYRPGEEGGLEGPEADGTF
ncbi:MAG: tetratricopeptide repeat protein [Candidatus Coatesbacteria bacterium]|nr:tetratricopeptide repeat protein [Candidatus Coatesbacteria bacterium]